MTLLGLDVSSDEFHVYDGATSVHKRSAADICKWVASLPPDAVVGVEPTGRLHRPLLHALVDAGITAYMVNPFKVKRYHDASEFRVKTDEVDARILREYLRSALDPDKKPLHPYSPIKRAGEPLKDLLVYRQGLVDQLASLRQSHSALNRTAGITLAGIEKEFKKAICAADVQIRQMAAAESGYAGLLQIDGIGPVTAGVLAWLFSSHEFTSRHSAVCFAGMDIRIRTSGTYTGRSKMTKQGPPIVRRCLYLAANSLRRIPEWQPYFEQLQAKGRSKTEATNIAARKLLKIAYAVWHRELRYDRKHALNLN